MVLSTGVIVAFEIEGARKMLIIARVLIAFRAVTVTTIF
jgi:hypothetical protein